MMRLGFGLGLGDYRNPLSMAAQLVALGVGATSFWDRSSILTGNEQSLPDLLGGSTALTRGATTSAEASDPAFTAGATPYAALNGTSHYFSDAGPTPTFTKSTGKYATLSVVRVPGAGSFKRVLSSETASNNGYGLAINNRDARLFVGNGTAVSTTAVNSITYGTWVAVAGVVNDGSIFSWTSDAGASASVSLATLSATAISHRTPRLGGPAYTPASFFAGDWAATVVFNGSAPTVAQLSTVAAALMVGLPA